MGGAHQMKRTVIHAGRGNPDSQSVDGRQYLPRSTETKPQSQTAESGRGATARDANRASSRAATSERPHCVAGGGHLHF